MHRKTAGEGGEKEGGDWTDGVDTAKYSIDAIFRGFFQDQTFKFVSNLEIIAFTRWK